MSCVARLAQMADDMVGMEIYNHTDEEYRYSRNGSGVGEICCSLAEIGWREYKQAGANKKSIDDIKDYTHCYNGYRHAALALHHKREDK